MIFEYLEGVSLGKYDAIYFLFVSNRLIMNWTGNVDELVNDIKVVPLVTELNFWQ